MKQRVVVTIVLVAIVAIVTMVTVCSRSRERERSIDSFTPIHTSLIYTDEFLTKYAAVLSPKDALFAVGKKNDQLILDIGKYLIDKLPKVSKCENLNRNNILHVIRCLMNKIDLRTLNRDLVTILLLGSYILNILIKNPIMNVQDILEYYPHIKFITIKHGELFLDIHRSKILELSIDGVKMYTRHIPNGSTRSILNRSGRGPLQLPVTIGSQTHPITFDLVSYGPQVTVNTDIVTTFKLSEKDYLRFDPTNISLIDLSIYMTSSIPEKNDSLAKRDCSCIF